MKFFFQDQTEISAITTRKKLNLYGEKNREIVVIDDTNSMERIHGTGYCFSSFKFYG